MKRVLCVSLLTVAVLATTAEAQLLCALGPTAAYDASADASAPSSAQADLKRVKAALCPKGCGKILLVTNPTAPDALTATTGLGVSQIAFNPKFLAAVRALYGPSATIGIIGHELGHHVDAAGDHPSWMTKTWDAELRADAWAGCALGKSNLRTEGVQAALLAMAAYPPVAHPSWTTRLPAVEVGYAQCTGGKSLPSPQNFAKRDAEVGAAQGGCTADRECRNGRVCVAGRCGAPPPQKSCGKDTDCPDPQECGADGHCRTPPRAEPVDVPRAAPSAKPPETPETAPAAPTAAVPKPSQATENAATCEKSCDEVRDRCLEAAASARSQCSAFIEAEPNYHSCTCPRYPEGNYGCYVFCTDAYQRRNACFAQKGSSVCQTDGASCRAKCPDATSEKPDHP
jgi:hypothetical protein